MKRIFHFLFFLLSLFIITNCYNADGNQNSNSTIYVANWNVENLFDTKDDPIKNDEWFLPSSEINWTEKKLITKMDNLARVINFMNNGNGPDLLGIEEVENQKLLSNLIDEYVKKDKYQLAYSESPDARGIDNALIYNSQKFGVEAISPIKIEFDSPKSSRDILYVKLVVHSTKEILNVFVNHWPSRREGLKKSEKFRINAAESLVKFITKIKATEENPNLIILGDFNDVPANISIKETLGAKQFNCDSTITSEFKLLNLAYKKFQEGKGSYKYKNHWNMLDQIIISSSLIDGNQMNYICNSFEIIKPDFTIQKTGKYKGTSLPTYGGRKYLGGYSDHFAVGAKFKIIK